MSEVISLGLTLTIPTRGDVNWETTIRNSCFVPISQHDHTGGGNGVQLGPGAIAANALTGATFRLNNNQFLRSLNAAASQDVDILGVDTSNRVIIGSDADGIDLRLRRAGTELLQLTSAALTPIVTETVDLGSLTLRYPAFLAATNLKNNTALGWRNFANDTSLANLTVNTSNQLVINTLNDILLQVGAVTKFTVNADIVPTGTSNLGSLAARMTGGFFTNVNLANNSYLESRNQAGNGNLSLLRANTSNQVELNTTTDLLLTVSGTQKWKMDSNGNLYGAGAGSSSFIGNNTTDGTDSANMFLASASAASDSRGSFIQLSGNEVASVGGQLDLNAGNTSTGNIRLLTTHASSSIAFSPGGSNKWNIGGNGHITPQSTASFDIGSSTGPLFVRDIFATNLKGMGWSTFTPNVTGVDVTFTGGTVDYARYIKIGSSVLLLLRFTGFTVTVAGTTVEFDLPVTSASSALVIGGQIAQSNGTNFNALMFTPSTTKMRITRVDGGNFTTSGGIFVSFFYEASSTT